MRCRLLSFAAILMLSACDSGGNDADPDMLTVDPDLLTTESACAAVDEAVEMMRSTDMAERAQGVDLAEILFLGTSDDVANGMRRTCGPSVIDMLDAADLRP